VSGFLNKQEHPQCKCSTKAANPNTPLKVTAGTTTNHCNKQEQLKFKPLPMKVKITPSVNNLPETSKLTAKAMYK